MLTAFDACCVPVGFVRSEEKDLEVPKPDVNPDTEEEAEEQKAENEVAAEEQTAKAGDTETAGDAGGDAGK